ncbi:MAG: hypothetical protein PF445_09800, partial [Melioribacteraceae bacterium]|nr:hypothetical protein [Melioribacteraceae bacterium]
RGQPESKRKRSDFYKNEILNRYDFYFNFLLKFLHEEDSKDIKDLFLVGDKRFQKAYSKQFQSKKESNEFERGAQFASNIIRNLLLEIVTDEFDDFIQISSQIKKAFENSNELKSMGYKTEDISIIENIILKPFPNDNVRQHRKPKIEKEKIIAFINVVKSAPIDTLPTLKYVASKLDVHEEEVLECYNELKKQRMQITTDGKRICYNGESKFFFITDKEC